MTAISVPFATTIPSATSAPARRVADQYDHDYNYEPYWDGRDYEDGAERLALRRILKDRRFGTAVDLGGGFGRLTRLVAGYAESTTLVEPSTTQLAAAERVLAGTGIHLHRGQADALPFATRSVDLVTMIRVMHHLPDPTPELAEIARVLRPGGTAIIEVAHHGHALNRWRYRRAGRALPTGPVSLRTRDLDDPDGIPFVNHDLDQVLSQLTDAGLTVQRMLSVSNLRSDRCKRVLPQRMMLALEWCTQGLFAGARFGPSMIIEVRRG